MHSAFLHSHVSAWAIALILFIIALFLMRAKKQKALKIMQMILRVFYILIIGTGATLLYFIGFEISFIIKAILAIWLIYIMEMLLVRGSKGLLDQRKYTFYWFQLAVSLTLIFLIGYRVISF